MNRKISEDDGQLWVLRKILYTKRGQTDLSAREVYVSTLQAPNIEGEENSENFQEVNEKGVQMSKARITINLGY